MKTSTLQDALLNLLDAQTVDNMDANPLFDEDDGPELIQVSTFSDAGVLTHTKGLVLDFMENNVPTQYQLSIVRSR